MLQNLLNVALMKLLRHGFFIGFRTGKKCLQKSLNRLPEILEEPHNYNPIFSRTSLIVSSANCLQALFELSITSSTNFVFASNSFRFSAKGLSSLKIAFARTSFNSEYLIFLSL